MKNLLFLLLAVVLLCGCKDRKQDEDTLPPATQEGKNTGGALVDGKVWVAKIESPDLNPGGNNTEYKFVNGQYHLQIVLREYRNTNNRIVINITDSSDFINKTYNFTAGRYERLSEIYDVSYGSNIGTITITRFDKTNKVVSGLFNFSANNINDSGQKVTITEGRFDKTFL